MLILTMALAAAPLADVEGLTTTVDHPGGAITADYRGDVTIGMKQVGAAAPGGRPSTLRCMWTARLRVERQAVGAGGMRAARSFTAPGVVEGSRAGWCDGQRPAIEREVAAQMQRGLHLQHAAYADHHSVSADFDRLLAGR